MKLTKFPHLVKEWHPTKNGDLTPEDYTHATKKKVWWLCPRGHSYKSIIGNRTKKKPTGCPYCAGQKVSEENNLLALFPEIAKEWHPTKNNELTPKQVTSGGNKKVWWLCPKGHSYESTTSHRTAMKSGCPYCSGHKVSEDNNLLFLFPEIAKEWHPTKNGVLTPKNFTTGVDKIIWWLCPKGHSYESMINNRTQKKYPAGCPYCSGRRVGDDNNLLVVFPEIAKEWHPTKNGDLTPEDFVSGSQKKVWWLCSKGHSYNAVIGSRTRKDKPSGCPFCSNQSSEQEIRILSELKCIFKEVSNRYKVDGREIDIYLPSIALGIEYDGNYWHKDKEAIDLDKNEFLLSQDIHLIRVRQYPLKPLSRNDLIVGKESLEKKDLDEILRKISLFVDNSIKEKIDAYLLEPSFVNEKLFNEYRSCFPSPIPENSLLETHPLISSEWDYEKNHPLRPRGFTYGSKKKVWWQCLKGHSYNSSIGERTRRDKPTGCPFCSGKKASAENNLLKLFPEIAKEWHPTENKKLTPGDVTSKSDKKVWWLCSKGHSYKAVIKNRTIAKSRCPYCSNKKASETNNLLILFPEIAKEWHPTKNKELTPKDFTYGSHKDVWWLCPKGHSYEKGVYLRTHNKQPSGCPFCSGRKTLNYDLF